MINSNGKILIVDDEKHNLIVLTDLLKSTYEVIATKSGKKALQAASGENPPDLILLDIMMPEMDGYEVCRRLKENEATRDIPVIFITAMNQTEDEIRGFDIGAVDFITKPICPPTVMARVETHIKLRKAILELKRLYSAALDANPMTGLPGNNSIANRINLALEKNEEACIIYSDLDSFKAFNDRYGFVKGDLAIMYTSTILQKAVKATKSDSAFIGHIGGDDFVLVVPSDQANQVAADVIHHFDQGISQFYSTKDAKAKCIHSVNRIGEEVTFPLMSISMAGVDLSRGAYKEYVEINDACAETKKKAKETPGSVFFMDRRSK
ncbi:response regulator [Vibrio sp. JC009]|uniref:response regulator n=1 Tax=Vibrio sp. JC009 TaxID=2912314 RepID=UPI0023AEB3FF|nr:response regulator [Vibrio sp. JC009]WED20540.1 response regulator [Vibrio sp. JC009]